MADNPDVDLDNEALDDIVDEVNLRNGISFLPMHASAGFAWVCSHSPSMLPLAFFLSGFHLPDDARFLPFPALTLSHTLPFPPLSMQTFREADLVGDDRIHPEEWMALVKKNPSVVAFMTLPVLGQLTKRFPTHPPGRAQR